jgi:hypothetical protein
VEAAGAFMAFLNDGRCECLGQTIDAASPEIAEIRRVVLDAVSELHRSGQAGSTITPGASARLASLHGGAQQRLLETDGPRRAVLALCSMVFGCILESPRYGGYLVLGRCRREACRRWFMEDTAQRAYCRPACRRSEKTEQTRGRVRRLRSRRSEQAS